MSLFFDVLWLEDTESWLDTQIKFLHREFAKKQLILRVNKQVDADGFLEVIKNSCTDDQFHHYDIILVDYKLSSAKALTGDTFIKQMRLQNINSNILF